MYEHNGGQFCHSCGIKSLTEMATKAGESRRQARSFHDSWKEQEEITKKEIEKAKKMISDSKKDLATVKKAYTKQEKERVDIEKEYKRLSKTIGVVVTNPFAAVSTRDLNTPSASGINKDIEQSLQTLEKNAIEKYLGAKGGAGHQEQGEEGEGWKMGDDQIRDVARLLTLGHKEVNLKFFSKTPIDRKCGEWTIKFDVDRDWEEDVITLVLDREGMNTDFSFKAEVQIVSGKSGRLRNEDDEDRNVASELEDGLQTIGYTYDKSDALRIKEDLEDRFRRRGGYWGHFDPDEYAVRFNITLLDKTAK